MRKAEINNRGLVTSQDVCIDKEYIEWLHELKTRFRSAQIKAAVKANSEQLLFNWLLDRDLVIRKTEEKWGVESLTESVWIFKQSFRMRKVFLRGIFGL